MSLPDVVVYNVHFLSTPNENFVSILVYDGQNFDRRQIFLIKAWSWLLRLTDNSKHLLPAGLCGLFPAVSSGITMLLLWFWHLGKDSRTI